jgi:hypothetical protein
MSKDPKEVLKECVAAPFGKAEEILKTNGFWNETKVPSGELRTYKVEVCGEETIEWSETITVEATSPDEAIELAEDQVPNHVDITSSEIVSSK